MDITGMFLLVIVVILILFDVIIIMKKGKHASISAYVIRGSKKYPLVVLAFGILLGHLFWSMDSFDYLDLDVLKSRCEEVLKR